MIKAKANIIMFDKINRNCNIFPKNCEIDIPQIVPLRLGFDLDDPSIGFVENFCRDEKSVVADITINCGCEDVLRELMNEDKVYVGGYYSHVEMHDVGHIKVIDSMKLRYVGLTYGDVYGDKSLLLKGVKEDCE